MQADFMDTQKHGNLHPASIQSEGQALETILKAAANSTDIVGRSLGDFQPIQLLDSSEGKIVTRALRPWSAMLTRSAARLQAKLARLYARCALFSLVELQCSHREIFVCGAVHVGPQRLVLQRKLRMSFVGGNCAR